MLGFIDRTPLYIFVLLAGTLGLAPMVPEPHIWEKLKMLFAGTLVRPVDLFDFVFHGWVWVLLAVKLVRMTRAA